MAGLLDTPAPGRRPFLRSKALLASTPPPMCPCSCTWLAATCALAPSPGPSAPSPASSALPLLPLLLLDAVCWLGRTTALQVRLPPGPSPATTCYHPPTSPQPASVRALRCAQGARARRPPAAVLAVQGGGAGTRLLLQPGVQRGGLARPQGCVQRQRPAALTGPGEEPAPPAAFAPPVCCPALPVCGAAPAQLAPLCEVTLQGQDKSSQRKRSLAGNRGQGRRAPKSQCGKGSGQAGIKQEWLGQGSWM